MSGEARMFELALEELAGHSRAPDLRARFAQHRARRHRRRWLAAAVLLLGLGAWWLGADTGSPGSDGPDPLALLRHPEAQLAADPTRHAALRRAQQRAELSLRQRLQREPGFAAALQPRIEAALAAGPSADARSRLLALLAAVGAPAKDAVRAQLRTHAAELQADCLLRLAAAGFSAAAELLRARDPAGRADEVLHRAWLLSEGRGAQVPVLLAAFGQPERFALRPGQFAAAALALYRQRSYAAWDLCYRDLRFVALRELDQGRAEAARELVLHVAWFYRQLNQATPLDLRDTRWRAEAFIQRETRTASAAALVHRWLRIMR